LTLDGLYPRLLDAWVTEHTTAFVSRHDVREAIEKTLDSSQPATARGETRGMRMTRQQLDRLQAASAARSKARRETQGDDADADWRPTPRRPDGTPVAGVS
jgi:hypothetical protein